ncbi:MAG TPA: hypothetical protein PKE26_08065 [Kiritimatiellia bacterium]|nr:hypothetical protein [Kiritimatiellia bacterium]HMO99048.1 hypothetical protein [Kiritimatiellia bacterium]HMP96124.1 hypothetical protein [Kiritimatiellia bacterium]
MIESVMHCNVTFRVRRSAVAIFMAAVMAMLSFPMPNHECLAGDLGACSSCCCHAPSDTMTCCSDDQAKPMAQDLADADDPVCCYTVYTESGTTFVPARLASDPMPVFSSAVVCRLSAPSTDASLVSPLAVTLPAGTRAHLALCQLLI